MCLYINMAIHSCGSEVYMSLHGLLFDKVEEVEYMQMQETDDYDRVIIH